MSPGTELNSTTPITTYPGVRFDGVIDFFDVFSFGGGFSSFFSGLSSVWSVYAVVAILLSIIFFILFIYSKIRFSQLFEVLENNIKDEEAIWAARHETADTKNARWESIKQKVADSSPESWRVAIIEADIMLDETLTNAGYPGTSLGEKLKSANPESFTTIQDAWEAHKVRNEVAHTGSDFVLTQKSAKETITRFERVFSEFKVI